MATTRLKREPNPDIVAPKWPGVQVVMQQILVDDDEQSVTLQFDGVSKPSELVIIRVNDTQSGEATGWLVEYISGDGQELTVLTSAYQNETSVTREFFGAVVDVRETCFPAEADIQSAVVHFLQTGKPNPSQTWVDYFAAIHSH